MTEEVRLSIRERSEELERQTLSPHAVLAAKSRGRLDSTPPEDDIRTCFQRDRDRILHCNSFRRLKHKTQVFLSPQSDHYRTRLTHTLEVSQIARTISRALRLNEDLTEAIALGHDLGHTPFGHAGERALNEVCTHGFCHNLQSVRVVHTVEKEGAGLNLTWEVKNGIACHSGSVSLPATLEGMVVRISDKVAYINHDIEDAVRAGVLREDQLPYDCLYVLGRSKSERITTIIRSIIENSGDDIRMNTEVLNAHLRLQEFMFEAVYTNPVAKSEEGKAEKLVQSLFEHFMANPSLLPAPYPALAKHWGTEQAVCDYVAGMTDQYAVDTFNRIHIPHFWTV